MNILLWQFPWENLFFSIDKGKLKKTQVALEEYKESLYLSIIVCLNDSTFIDSYRILY